MNKEEIKDVSIHFKYAILILIIILIYLLAIIFFQAGKSALSHLNIAASITSILLGFLAIVYAYISNNSFSSSSEKIRNAADGILSASNSITQSTENLEEISALTKYIKTEINKINSSVSNFSTRIEEIAPQVSETSSFMRDTIPKHFEEIKSIYAFSSRNFHLEVDESNSIKNHKIELDIKKFNRPLLLVIIACKISFDKNIEIDLLKIIREIKEEEENSFLFYYSALQLISHFELIDLDRSKLFSQEAIILATSFPEKWRNCEELFKLLEENDKDDEKITFSLIRNNLLSIQS